MSSLLDPERWRELSRHFRRTLDLPAVERAEHLRLVRSTDPELADELASLLEAHDALEAAPDTEGSAGTGGLGRLDPAMAAGLFDGEVPGRLEAGATVGRYRVIRRLGRGGMGEVYLAEDPRLDRRVALKLLPPWLASDELARRRFALEARATSSLDHPNITTIYEIDESADGRVYIAMAYHEGRTLAERIARGPLPIDEAVEVARQIASGLAAAHEVGIVHRDLKPSNVMLTAGGSARILDFGVAKVKGSMLTRDGFVPGTVAYMSPEQTRGEACDARSDLWSLGVVLHEMVTGERPFATGGSQALVYAIRHDDPPSLRRARPEAPEALGGLVERLLDKEPDRRPASADEVIAALQGRPGERAAESAAPGGRNVAAGAIALLGVGLLAFLLVDRDADDAGAGDETVATAATGFEVPATPAARPAPAAGRIAVLPLDEVGGGRDQGYFAAGLTAELITRLGSVPELGTIAYASVRSFRDSDLPAAEIGRALGARTVLEGSVRQTGESVRLALRLVDATSGREIWSDAFGGPLEALAEIQDSVAASVASALRIEHGLTRTGLRHGTSDPEAYLRYLEARHFWNRRDPEGLRRARRLFERAVDLDPVFAEAWAGLADTYLSLGSYGMMPAADAFPRARAAAERALAVQPALAEAHAALATALADYFWAWDEAERRLRRAIELQPSYAPAHYWLSELLANRGRSEEAILFARRAQDLDPLSRLARADEGRALYQGRRFDEAITIFDRTLEDGPNFVAYLYRGLAHAEQGNLAEAVATLEEGREAYPQIPTATALLAYAYGRAGRAAEARQLLDELMASRESGTPVAAIDVAAVHLGLGHSDRALDWLETAIDERNWQVVFLETEPIFDPLREDHRFAELLERVEPLEPERGPVG